MSSQGTLLFSILSYILFTVVSLKGVMPTINSNNITPTLHQSSAKSFSPYPLKISGAI